MRYLKIFATLVVIVIGLVVWIGFYLSPQSRLVSADAIVVISGGETDERVAEGVQLFNHNLAPVMIMSGAARDAGPSNAEAMKQIAIRQGVSEDKIIIEENAQDTIGNAKYVKDLIEQNKIQSIILVTSPYHQRRAYITFHQYLGDQFTIINHSSADSAWRKNGWWRDAWARQLTWQELQKNFYLTFLFKPAP